MKRLLSMLLASLFTLSMAACNSESTVVESASEADVVVEVEEEEIVPINLAAISGPTAMGMAKLIAENDGSYNVTLATSPDELVSKIVTGELDIAAIPANLAATLWNKTEGKVQLAAINTLGVLYLVENGDTIHSMEDLSGQTIYLTGKGSTPEFALMYLLEEYGYTVGEDVFVEFKTENAELATLLAADQATIALLPEPFVSSAKMQNENLRVALDLNDVWATVSPESGLAMGALLVQNSFVEENPEAYAAFMAEYAESVAFALAEENLTATAQYIEDIGVLKATVAEAALPNCSIVNLTGAEMKSVAEGFLTVLFNANPQSVGGTLPDASFYGE